jgi:hypothetical protein
MKALIQNNFATGTTVAPKPSSPIRKQIQTVPDLKSVISDRGDPKMNFERLRLLLPKIHYPQVFEERAALDGHPTQFMKVISYTLFVSSASVKAFLIDKGVDPDTVYLNDY